MDKYIDCLRTYLTEKESSGLEPECDSLLETLYLYYNASVSVEGDKVKAAEEALQPLYETLSYDATEEHFDIVSDLCIAYERAAFIAGIRAGARLISELIESSPVM